MLEHHFAVNDVYLFDLNEPTMGIVLICTCPKIHVPTKHQLLVLLHMSILAHVPFTFPPLSLLNVPSQLSFLVKLYLSSHAGWLNTNHTLI
jgi:hypothetical protein